MKIQSISQLKSVLKLCQEYGVIHIDIDGIKMNISHKAESHTESLELQPEAYVPVPTYSPISESDSIAGTNGTGGRYPGGAVFTTPEPPPDKIDTPDQLTEDQALFYSAKAEPQ